MSQPFWIRTPFLGRSKFVRQQFLDSNEPMPPTGRLQRMSSPLNSSGTFWSFCSPSAPWAVPSSSAAATMALFIEPSAVGLVALTRSMPMAMSEFKQLGSEPVADHCTHWRRSLVQEYVSRWAVTKPPPAPSEKVSAVLPDSEQPVRSMPAHESATSASESVSPWPGVNGAGTA